MTNPYEPPRQAVNALSPSVRGAFTLAGAAAFLASIYWGVFTLLVGFGAAMGSTSPLQILLPVVLVVLYAMRGFQLLKGDVAAARRLIWLHGVGAVAAFIQLLSGQVVILLAIKVAINVFGAVTAYRATRVRDLSL